MSYIAKLSNSGGVKSLTRYTAMLAGNTVFDPSSYDSIATLTGNGSASSLTFSSIPSTYSHLQIRLIARGVRSFPGEQLYIRANGDGGSNYAYHYLYGDGAGVSAGANTSVGVFLLGEFPAANETSNIFSSSIVDILDYGNANKNTTFRSVTAHDNAGNTANLAGKVWHASGLWMNTAAITSLTVLSNGAFATNTQFALYGIKG
jgi:hypothetical protein